MIFLWKNGDDFPYTKRNVPAIITWHGSTIVMNIFLRQAMERDILSDIPFHASPPAAAPLCLLGTPQAPITTRQIDSTPRVYLTILMLAHILISFSHTFYLK